MLTSNDVQTRLSFSHFSAKHCDSNPDLRSVETQAFKSNPFQSLQIKLANMEQMSRKIEEHNTPETLFSLPERIVSAESVIYLVKQFRKMKKLILKCMPQEDAEIVNSVKDYYQQVSIK